ncbi:MAG: putative peptidoglycan glycosyltransferase FtsW [bacterium]|nr:putative peptidoglycan glycosyltransferase FtsW [bacterium]
MEKKHRPDPILFGICILLVAVGILVLASVSASFSLQRFGTTFYFFIHQITHGLLPGLLLGSIAFFTPLTLVKRFSLPLLLGAIVLVGLVFIPGIGVKSGEALRWISFFGFSFQPSELLKPAFIVYLAAWLANRVSQKNKNAILIPFFAILVAISLFLVAQPAISTLGIIGIIGLAMYFFAGTPVWHTALLLLGGLFILMKLAAYSKLSYVLNRVAVFLDPSLDPLGKGYQIQQALIGIGSGGITGVGLGLSFQKFGSLPEPIGDSIFAIFAEEMGLIGAVFLILLFLAFAWRSFIVAQRVQDPFAKNAVIGVACWITVQAFVNMGAMIGIIPLTGVPLPFISYGGSALIAELIGIGILLNISKQA